MTPIYPHSGVCERCRRERDDLFFHAQDEAYYCADVFRCEARYEIQAARTMRLATLTTHMRPEGTDG